MTKKLISTTLPPVPKVDDQGVRRFLTATSSIIEELSRRLVISEQGSVSAVNTPSAADDLQVKAISTVTTLTKLLPALSQDTTTPSTPANLTVGAAIETFILTWTWSGSTSIDRYEIMRAEGSGGWQFVGSTKAKVFADTIGLANGTTGSSTDNVSSLSNRIAYHYQVRAVSTGGTSSPPVTSTNNYLAPNPAAILASRSGGIYETDLTQTLLSGIPNLATIPETTDAFNLAIANETSARQTAFNLIDSKADANEVNLTAEIVQRGVDDVFNANTIGQTNSDVANEILAREVSDNILTGSTTALGIDMTTAQSDIINERQTTINENQAINLSISGVLTKADNALTGILNETQSRISGDEVASSSSSSAFALANDASSAVVAESNARILLDQSTGTAISSSAADTETLVTAVGNNVSAIQTNMQAEVDSINGTMSNSYTLHTEVHGTNSSGQEVKKIAGFGIQNSSAGPSQFIVSADMFAVVGTASDGTVTDLNTPMVPFLVDNTQNPPAVMMNNAFIANLSANNIAAGAITSDNLTTGLINSQHLNIGTIVATDTATFGGSLQSSNYVSGQSGWRITGSGTAEFQTTLAQLVVSNSTISGSVFSLGNITGSDIEATDIHIKTAITTSDPANQPYVTLFDNDGYSRGGTVSLTTQRDSTQSASSTHDDGVTSRNLYVSLHNGAAGVAQSPYLSMVSYNLHPTSAATYTGITNQRRQRFRSQTINVTDEVRAMITVLNSDFNGNIYYRSQILQIDGGTETTLADTYNLSIGAPPVFSTNNYNNPFIENSASWSGANGGFNYVVKTYGTQWGRVSTNNDPGNLQFVANYANFSNAFFKVIATWTGGSFTGAGKIFTKTTMGGFYSWGDGNYFNKILYQSTTISGS